MTSPPLTGVCSAWDCSAGFDRSNITCADTLQQTHAHATSDRTNCWWQDAHAWAETHISISVGRIDAPNKVFGFYSSWSICHVKWCRLQMLLKLMIAQPWAQRGKINAVKAWFWKRPISLPFTHSPVRGSVKGRRREWEEQWEGKRFVWCVSGQLIIVPDIFSLEEEKTWAWNSYVTPTSRESRKFI